MSVRQSELPSPFFTKTAAFVRSGDFSSIFLIWKFLCLTIASTSSSGSSEPRGPFSLDQALDQLSGDEGEVRSDEDSGESVLDVNSSDSCF